MHMFISGYNRIPNHLNTLRVDTKIFVSLKKYLQKKKFPDACGHGLSRRRAEILLLLNSSQWVKSRACSIRYLRLCIRDSLPSDMKRICIVTSLAIAIPGWILTIVEPLESRFVNVFLDIQFIDYKFDFVSCGRYYWFL